MTSQKLSLPRREWIISLLLVVVLYSISNLPHIQSLGFYKDDWHMIFAGDSYGPQKIVEEFSIDRPFMGVVNAFTFDILGDSPHAWAWFAFFARLAGVVGLFWLLRKLWPKQVYATTAMSALFAVYPGFMQQPNAATFQNHFVGYSAGILSLLLTVLALQTSRKGLRAALTGLSMALMLLCALIYEYMIGLEGIRLFLIWYLTWREEPLPFWKQVKKVVLIWLPYLAVVGGFVFWRVFIYKSTRYATSTGVLAHKYLAAPFAMTVQLAAETIKDFFETTVLAWFVPFYQLTTFSAYGLWFASLALGLAGAAIFLGYRRWVRRRVAKEEDAEEADPQAARWKLAAIIIGGLGVLVTLIPVLLSDRTVYFKDQFDRYTLQATVGVVMLLGGLIFLAVRSRWRTPLLAGLIVISIMTQYHNIDFWKHAWSYQQEFWWQVSWRIPQIEPDTVLMAYLPSGYRLAEDYEAFSPANLIYYPGVANTTLVAEVLNSDTADEVRMGSTSDRSVRTFDFTRHFDQSLIITWPGNGSCVHVQDGSRLELSELEDPVVDEVAPYSKADRIDVTAQPPVVPASIFGAEPAHTWCYYYQKASLARQAGDWNTVTSLADQVQSLGLAPQDLSEWMPFLEGLVRANREQDAQPILDQLNKDDRQRYLVCQRFLAPDAASDPTLTSAEIAFFKTTLCAAFVGSK